MTLKQALKRIEELENRVKQLEAAPKQEYHYHYHTPAYVPLQPYQPYWVKPVWCGTSADTSLLAQN
jgi:hypothetical protein